MRILSTLLLTASFCIGLALRAEVPALSPATLEADAVLLPSRSVKLSLPVEATLRELRVKEGDFVKKGNILVVLYSPAESLERERAEKHKELAAFQLRVSDKLRADAIVSEEQAHQKRIDHDVATIEARRAQAILDDKTIVAPFDGCVLRIFKEPGETVSRVEKIVEMVDYSKLYAESYLESPWLGAVRRGSAARIIIPQLGEQAHNAIVENVDPVVDPASGLFRVRLVIDNSDYAIPSGVPAKVIFTLGAILGATNSSEPVVKPGSN